MGPGRHGEPEPPGTQTRCFLLSPVTSSGSGNPQAPPTKPLIRGPSGSRIRSKAATAALPGNRIRNPGDPVSCPATCQLSDVISLLSRFSRVQLFATPRTVAHQVPLSMGFSRQESRSGLPFPPPGDLPDPRDRTQVSCVSCMSRRVLFHWATWETCVFGKLHNPSRPQCPSGLRRIVTNVLLIGI